MKKLSVLVVFGTRPEAIKMAPVVKELARNSHIKSEVCVTAQHREMLDQVLELFSIKPEYDLNLMKRHQDLTQLTSSVLSELSSVLMACKPDRVLVHGDTTTTMAASLASFYQKIPVGHVESGLRSGNIHSPWPEELNRKIVTTIADLHFAPTDLAKRNLQREGVADSNIFVTGNTVIDALLSISARLDKEPELDGEMLERFSFLDRSKKLILVTAHRRESFGTGFDNIAQALLALSKRGDIQIVYPLHPNPNVREPIVRTLSDNPNIALIEPLDYLPFIYLMKRSFLILTDSGGVQEEAPSLGKPVLVMRDTTERPEAVEAGTSKIIGTNADSIISAVEQFCDNAAERERMIFSRNPYGDGYASSRIVEALIAKHGYVKSGPRS